MTLDRLTAPGDVMFDSRHHCDRCGDHVPTLIRLCAYCATPPRTETPKEITMTSQPDPRFPDVPPEQIGDTLLLPDYCVQVAELLAATENHRDPGVRAIRKIVTQAAIALDQAQAACPPACRVCGCTDDAACEDVCWWVEPDLCSSCAPETSGSDAPPVALPAPVSTSTSKPGPHFETFAKPKRKSSAAVLLMAKHNVEASTVREWCLGEGIECPERGALPLHAVEAYCQANGLEAA